MYSLFAFVVATWLAVLLLCSGDLHPNPGPSLVSSTESLCSTASNLSSSILNSLTTGHNLFFIHYNVQSILNKLDILQAELSEFDISAFRETWLSPQTDTADLDHATYFRPERPVGATSRYNLRNSNSLQTIDARTNQYLHSFLRSTVRAWNNLPNDVKQRTSVNSFKYNLKPEKIQTPKHFYFGSRKAQILHTRLRTNCSSLNLDLFHRNITESPLCHCGSVEDSQHFFFHCRTYHQHRIELLNTIAQYMNLSLQLLLYGNPSLSLEIKYQNFRKCA